MIRSGLYYEGRFYETDGTNAIGIHEASKVRLHAPVGQPASLRLWDVTKDDEGQEVWRYSYAHSGGLEGPASSLEILDPGEGWDLEARVTAILSDSGGMVEPGEAPSMILGYSILLMLCPPERDEDLRLGFPTSYQTDGGSALGPFVVTPDELLETRGASDTEFKFPYEIMVNDSVAAAGVWQTPIPMSHLAAYSSVPRSLIAGDAIAWPALPKPPLDMTPLGRTLLPTDRIQVKVEGLGPLVVNIA